MLECVVNVSEGRDPLTIDAVADAAGTCLLDVHSDPHHHRTVLTLAGDVQPLEDAVRALARQAVARIDLRAHAGVHPRLGAIDVVPFVPLGGSTIDDAVQARNRFARWAADELALPCFLYGPPPERSLPDVRRQAFRSLRSGHAGGPLRSSHAGGPLLPDTGTHLPHPTAGAACVGARPLLVAYNLWLVPGVPVEEARRLAAALRGGPIRALGLDVGGQAQVSLNLVEPFTIGPTDAYDRLVALGAPLEHAELVGLVPRAVLDPIPAERWPQLDLGADRTIEARLARAATRKRRSPDGGPATAPGAAGDAPAR